MKYVVVLIVGVLSWAAPVTAAESFPSFFTHIEVRTDSTLRITETVEYDMDTVERHGLERIIPRQSADGPAIVISDVVATRDGRPDQVNITGTHEGYTIRIGDPDVTMTGQHTYVLSYSVYNEIRYFDDRDEVYWNAIPQGLRYPIESAVANIRLPDGAVVLGSPWCYTGAGGSTESDCQLNTYTKDITAVALRPFAVSEGMSIAVAIEPGTITRVPPVEVESDGPSGSNLLFIAFSAILFMFFAITIPLFWIYAFRLAGLPKKRADGGDIVVQYDPPAGCNAPSAAYLAGPTMTGRIFTSAVVQLAVEGWLKMRFNHEKKWYGKKTEILFIQSREGHPEDPTLHQVMDALFIIGPERTLTSLKQDAKLGAAPVTAIAAGIPLLLQRKGWIATSGVARFMRRYTPEGTAVREHLAGLKHYLGAAEKERLEFHNAPQHSPQTFEKLLPYAIALGVDEPWRSQFGDLQTMPQWTEGDFSAVGMVALSQALGDLSRESSVVMNAFASGTGSGGSSGGGSSGGGGGGGGGGGW